MAEVIDLDAKKRQDQARKALEERSRRLETVRQIFQCSRCAMKCMKCGSQMEQPAPAQEGASVPYRLCTTCRGEYHEFLERLHGRGDPAYYWYNQEWMGVWKAWMHYQDALSRYEVSEGFRRVMEELRKP
jgi:hypothetical protein